jgi:hypothetical protein
MFGVLWDNFDVETSWKLATWNTGKRENIREVCSEGERRIKHVQNHVLLAVRCYLFYPSCSSTRNEVWCPTCNCSVLVNTYQTDVTLTELLTDWKWSDKSAQPQSISWKRFKINLQSKTWRNKMFIPVMILYGTSLGGFSCSLIIDQNLPWTIYQSLGNYCLWTLYLYFK